MSNCLPKCVYYSAFPPAIYEFLSPYILASLWWVLSVSGFWPSWEVCGCISLLFEGVFPDDTWCQAPFHMLTRHLCIFLVKCLVRSLIQFLVRSLVSLYWILEFFVYFGKQSFIKCDFCKYFLLICDLFPKSFKKFKIFIGFQLQLSPFAPYSPLPCLPLPPYSTLAS